MNKAFVRESESDQAWCPRCGSLGSPVGSETLATMIRPGSASGIATAGAFFCPDDHCDAVYFDIFERFVPRSEVVARVYPKDPAAPICPCFGLTTDDIDDDLDEGTVTRTRACVDRAQSGEARCATRSPKGTSCIADVQAYYMKRRTTHQ